MNFRKICPWYLLNLVQFLPKSHFGFRISIEFHFEKWQEKTQKPLWFLGFLPRYLNRCYLLVAETGLEPATSGLWARRATNCSTPRYWIYLRCIRTGLDEFGAGNRAWTGTRGKPHWILSPGRLPIPPLRQAAWLCYHKNDSVSILFWKIAYKNYFYWHRAWK